MTLHQAIERVLQEKGKALTSTELADLINEKKLYSRQDGAPIPASQISARAKNYENIFTRKNGKIGLVRNDLVSLGFEKYRREIKQEMDHLYKTGKGFDRAEILRDLLEKIKNEELQIPGEEDDLISEPQPEYGEVDKQYRSRLSIAYELSNWYLAQRNPLGFLNESFAAIVAKLKIFQEANISFFTGISGYNHFLLKLVAENPTSSFTVRAIENEGFLNESIADLINSGNSKKNKDQSKIGFFVPTIGISNSRKVPLEFEALLSAIEDSRFSLDKALLVIPTGALTSNLESFVNARKRLVQSKTLQGVISLPDNMIEGAAINLSLLLFDFSSNQKKVFLVDAQSDGEILSRILKSEEAEVNVAGYASFEEIEENNFQLAPLQYVSQALEFPVAAGNTVYELSELLRERKAGTRFPDRKALYTGGEVKVIRVPDLTPDTVNFKPTDSLLGVDHDNFPNKSKLVVGGIAVSAFNKKLKANVLPEEEQVFIDQNLYWLKPNSKVVIEEYLVGELLKPYVAEQVAFYSKGSGIVRLNLRDLLKIKIQLPSLEIQKEEVLKKFRKEKESGVAAVSDKELDFIKTLKHSLKQPTAGLGNDFSSLKSFLDRKSGEKEPIDRDELIVQVFEGESPESLKKYALNATLERMERAITDIDYILEQAAQVITVGRPAKKEIALKKVLSRLPSEYQEVEVLVSGPDVQLMADAKQLRIMLHNFIHNAQKHGFRGMKKAKVWIKIIDEDPHSVKIVIRNNGTPLPPQFSIEDFLAKGGSSSAEVGSGFGGFLIGQILKNHDGKVELGQEKSWDTLAYNVEFIVTLSK